MKIYYIITKMSRYCSYYSLTQWFNFTVYRYDSLQKMNEMNGEKYHGYQVIIETISSRINLDCYS